MTEAMDTHSPTATPTPDLPGVLTVTLHEAEGLSGPAEELKDERSVSSESYPWKFIPERHYRGPYALLDVDHAQATLPSFSGTMANPRWTSPGWGWTAVCRFDTTRAAELVIYLYHQDPKADRRTPHVFRGIVRLNIFDGTALVGPQWLDVQYGRDGDRV